MTLRTLLFFFDGTWNGRDDQHATNVRKLHDATRFGDQVPLYFAGPGNEDENSWFGELMGGAVGYGSNAIRDMAIDTLKAAYRRGDRIAAIGFSRGATIARMFCAEANKEIAFLGCFDTVGAYLPFGPSQQGLFHDLHVSPAVGRAAHAVALDETRKAFEPNLMNRRAGIAEVWFPGVHGDVGSGLAETGHSDSALRWMVDQMAAAGIQAEIETRPNPAAPIVMSEGMLRHGPRRGGVKVDDEWSDLDPVLWGEE